ncbi:DUF3311 domain-containing protein [Caldivirga sp.]|jgi:hypothetical protein|uniref:DUF3311 domain-containing protein n=1 Tax=Caldivirga sp. TaxID=2080243 RepID=UPI003D12025A
MSSIGRKITGAVLLAIPWVFYLMLPLYNVDQPELNGVPFFYWFQTLWLVITAVLSAVGAILMYGSGEQE